MDCTKMVTIKLPNILIFTYYWRVELSKYTAKMDIEKIIIIYFNKIHKYTVQKFINIIVEQNSWISYSSTKFMIII